MTTDGLPLRVGATGDAVRDLQGRLIGAGLDVGDDLGHYLEPTAEAVRRFQEQRGLVVDGICGRDTWSALIEAGYHLGDRLLYLRSPMLRGDDVIDLQLQLGSLGFDAGRVDGILGPQTEHALKDFQRNAGLTTDGVCGPDVLASLARLHAKTAGATQVAGIRERDRLAHTPRVLTGLRIVVGSFGGLDVPAGAAARALRNAGAVIVSFDHPDSSVQASEANEFGADLYLGLSVSADGCARAAYYGTPGFESAGGRRLAELVVAEFPEGLAGTRPLAAGMRLPILRETRMPAVLCHLTSVEALVEHHRVLAGALATAVTRWVEEPVDPDRD